MPQERKLATVLFADIVGSTVLGASHDPEVVREALGRTFAKVRDVLVTHGGTVEKFIGDAVMAVFGVPVTHDDDADRAVRAAFALREVMSRLQGSSPFELQLRTGVSTGEVVADTEHRDQLLVTGDAVNLAARLQQAASPGQILVGTSTRRLTQDTVTYGRMRTVKAKGVGSLEAWPAEALPSALPVQQRGIAGLRAPLIGRDEEMRFLKDAYRRVGSERRPYLVTVFATAGSGKSRLAQEFVDTIGPDRVRRGRCLPYGEGITFWPIQEILRADAGIGDSDPRLEARQKLRAAALAALGGPSEDADAVARRVEVLAGTTGVSEALPGIAPDAVADELRWGVRRYLDRRAAGEPLTLVFEDIHWAEPGLLDLIDHLAERSSSPLFLLCLARPELLETRPAWGGGKTNAASITVEPLSADETRLLIAELLAIDALPDELRAQVVTRAEGNPLYVEEFLRMLIDNGQVERRRGRWTATDAIGSLVLPPSLHGLIAARLDRVAPEVKQALMRASVMGKVFSTSVVAALDPDASQQARALTEAAQRDLVIELDEPGIGGGRAYRFKHIIVRDVAYAAIAKAERLRMHDRFSRWLDEIAGDRADEYGEIVAYHAEQAFLLARELGSPEANSLGVRAFRKLLPSARKAKDRTDWDAARALYRRASEIAAATPDIPAAERIETLGMASIARYSVEGTAAAIAELEGALEQLHAIPPGEALVLGLSLRAYAELSKSAERARPLFAEAVAAARATGDTDLLVQALLFSRRVHQWLGELDEVDRLNTEAYELARRSGSGRHLAQAVAGLARGALRKGELTGGLELAREAWRLADKSGSALSRYTAAWTLGTHFLFARDLGEARHWIEMYARTARDFGARELIGRGAEWMGELLYQEGDYDGSRRVLEEGLAGLDPTMRGAIPELQWKLARAHIALGDIEAARRTAEAARTAALPDDTYSRGTTAATLAEVRAAEGRHDEAEQLFTEALSRLHLYEGHDVRLAYARWLLDRGRIDDARNQLEAMRGYLTDPLAERRRQEVEALLRRCEAVAR